MSTRIRLTNESYAETGLRVDPKGVYYDFPNGSTLHILCTGSEGGTPEIVYGIGEIVVRGWPGSIITVLIEDRPGELKLVEPIKIQR